jgi:hypothetical protein
MARCTKNRFLLPLIPMLVSPFVACGGSQQAMTVADHEQALREHEAMIDIVESDCQDRRRNQLTTGPGVPSSAAAELTDAPYTPCWQAADRRELDAHERAAARHRAAIRKAQVQACAENAPGPGGTCNPLLTVTR